MRPSMSCSGSRDPQAPASGGQQPRRRGKGTQVVPPDDDLDLGLPDEDERATLDTDSVDDSWSPDDDSDLELDDGSEDVGLDTATGPDELPDDLDLDDTGEGVSWTADSEDAEDLPGADADLGQGEEYGWLGDDEPAIDDDELDLELGGEEQTSADDGGAEGLDDDELDVIDEAALPALDADSEEGADGGADAFDDLGGVTLADEPMFDVGEGISWKRLPEHSVRITKSLATADRPDAGADVQDTASRSLASCRSVRLLGDGPRVLCAVRGKATRELVPGAVAPAVLLDEDDEVFAYLWLAQPERVLLLRVATRTVAEPLVVAVLHRSTYGLPQAMTATYVEALVTLRVSTERADLTLEASLDGETLA